MNKEALLNMGCDKHAHYKLVCVRTSANPERRILCPECMLNNKIPYKELRMLGDFVGKEPPFSSSADNYEESEKKTGW